jgi:uncharacterized protein involved in exopolysaccharide biosynthesis/Mrp family chromosome partitioning ATPase
MEEPRPVSADLSHYLGVLRRHWWVLVIAIGVGLGAGTAVTSAMPKVYESSTSVLVQPVGQDTNASGGRTNGSINLDTEAQLVGSGAVAVNAAALLRTTTNPIELAKNVSVEVPANTTVLVISYQADNPKEAQEGSHAFAEAYLRNREATAQGGLDTQIKSLTLKIRQLTATLTSINSKLADAQQGSPERGNLESLRSNSQNQLNSLSGKLNGLTTTTVGAGSIISDARLPDAPTSPNAMLNVASGAMAGLLAGLLLAFVRERFDRRLRTVADVRDRARIGVLAALDERTTPHFDDVLQPYGPGGRIFNRLRNEVLASLEPGDQVIVVTGASRGAASTLVAANLAAALARTGSDVVLIGAHLPDSVTESAPLARMLGVSATPGLSDLLSGRVGLARALQRTPRIPSLRVITTGGAATAAGLMQSQRLRDALEALRRQGGYVVIEAPSTSSSADAQSLASLADAAILAIELRRTRRPAVLDAAEQLERVDTKLLGAVVLPRLTPLRPDDETNLPVVTLTQPPPPPRPQPQPAARREPARRDRAEAALDEADRAEADRAQGALDETAVLDVERTQAMRRPTGTISGTQVRPRPSEHEEATAVLDVSRQPDDPDDSKSDQ